MTCIIFLPRRMLLRMGLACIAVTCVSSARAVEEAPLFLNELRVRGYYDTANEYLDEIVKTDLVDEDFKKSVAYEQASNLVSQAGIVTDARERDKMLNLAIENFRTFAKDQPKHPLVNSVKMQVSNVYVAMAKAALLDVDKPGADKEAIRAKARKLFEGAIVSAAEAEELIQAERKVLEKLKPIPKAEEERRDFLRTEWVKSELLQAAIGYELSKAFEPGSDGHKQQLDAAAKQFEAMFEKHRRRLAGLYCRLQQGRCLLDKGDYEGALTCLADLTDQDDKVPQLRALKMEALRYAMECWIAQEKYDEAIQMGGFKMSSSDEIQKAGIALRFFLAKAHMLKANTLQGPADKRTKTQYLAKASTMLKALSKEPGEFQRDAVVLLEQLGVALEAKDPTTFDEALQLAFTAMRKRSVLKESLDKVAADKKQAVQEQIDAETEKAFNNLRLSLAFADNDTPSGRLSAAQRTLCGLYWERGQYMYAAVLGDYLARQYPGSEAAKFGAYVAMNAFVNEYQNAWQNKDYETSQIIRLAELIIERWPDSTEAVECQYRLVIFAVQRHDVAAALKLLEAIPLDSPHRGKVELTVGQTLWSQYARSLRLPADERPPQDELDQMLTQSEKILSDGLTRMEKGGKVNATLVGAAYSLAQLKAGINQPAEAIKLFEHEKYGPLTLVQAGDPVAKQGDYKLQTYRLALRSYIAALPDLQGNVAAQDQMLAKAMQMVTLLEKSVGEDDEAANRLTKIYIEMGRDLEDQINFLVEKDDQAGKEALSKAFEAFLGKIRSRPQANTYSSLIWIAETFFGLGNSNLDSKGKATEAGEKYFQQAAETYSAILANAAQDDKYLKNPRQRSTIEMRLIKCYSRRGQYEQALQRLVAMLRRKTSNLTLQVEAAETLFDAGVADCDNYTKSILGTMPDDKGKNIIWGWRKLAQITSKDKKYAPYFFQASLYGVKCRIGLAICLKQSDPAKHAKLLEAAEITLIGLSRQFPELGGEESKKEFDRALKKIQKEQGEEPLGLAALDAAA